MQDLGTRIRKIRHERNLTIEQLAVMCKSSENVIRGYEKSRRKPSSDMVIRICEALKIHPNYLYQDELSFNPYEEMGELFEKINRLPPDKYQLVVDMVQSLQKQEVEKNI